MSNFWTSGTGQPITGDAKAAFLPEFGIIPNGTTALAKIKSFEVVEKNSEYTGPQKFFQINWMITDGEFTGREVTQKIKAFNGKPEQIDRALNMLRLIMDLCQFKPTHTDVPSNQELMRMNGKICGIKIREWSMLKQDGSGVMEGNFVAEVHKSDGFESVTGEKMEPVVYQVDRQPPKRDDHMPHIDDDLPF